jgi:hypothetical protein
MPLSCFECGVVGHGSWDCPNKQGLAEDAYQASRPRWCGLCDQRSRHLELPDGRVKRCACHPNSHQELKHHRKCPFCHKTVVEWDSAVDCEHHILAGVEHHYVGPPVAVPAPPEPVDFIGTGQRPREYPA